MFRKKGDKQCSIHNYSYLNDFKISDSTNRMVFASVGCGCRLEMGQDCCVFFNGQMRVIET